MSLSVPKGCKTPKRDRDEYHLTRTDLETMNKAAASIWDMLVYYCNMPENRTGEIEVHGDKNYELFVKLCNTLNSILDDLNNMNLY